MNIEEKVISIIADQLGIDKGTIKPESSFTDDLKADSMDVVEMVMAFEDGFSVSIPDQDAEKIRTVQDAVDYIKEHQKTT